MARLRRLFRLSGREPGPEEDLAQEFETHLAYKADALIREGLSPEAARREAERRFGPLERFAAECRHIDRAERRERRWREWASAAWQDLRLAARGLVRAPAFALTAIGVLATGIGLTATAFTVLRGVVLRPLPYAHAERLVAVYSSNPQAGWPTFSVSPTDFYDWERDTRSFGAMVAWNAYEAAATGLGPAEQVPVVQVTEGFHAVSGTVPQLGRPFSPAEFALGAARVALLSETFWATRFGRDPAVLEKTLVLDGERYRIIGVMPRGFAFPADPVTAWAPFRHHADIAGERGAHYLSAAGRLAEGVTLDAARSEFVTLAARIALAYPRNSAGWTVVLKTLHEDVVGDVRPTLLLLMAGGGLLLVLACANVANLVLVRAIGKSGEAAVRGALGAGRGRLLWHGASEVLVLVLAGALAALPVALAGAGLIRRFAPPGVPRIDEVRLDLPVLLFTLGITACVALFVSLAPARRLARSDLRGGLAASSGRSVGPQRGLHRWLVALETAVALALLAVAGVLLKSMQRLERVDPGFDPRATLVAELSLSETRYPTGDAAVQFYQELLRRIRVRPGVESAALIFGLPLTGFGWSSSFTIDSVPVPDGKSQSAQVRIVSHDYFTTQRIPLVRGRGFTSEDRRGGRPMVLISAAAARKFWPDADPLSHFVRFDARPGPDRPQGEIVGIVSDVRERGLDQEPRPIFYVSSEQVSTTGLSLLVRTSVPPLSLGSEVRRIVTALDPELPVSEVRTMEDVSRAATAPQRFRAWLMGLFALLATALAAVGVYGVISHIVAQRTREMGLRRALGASDRQVVAQVVRGGMRDAAAGAAAGLALGWLITRQLAGLLFEVRPGDPVVLAMSAVLFLGIACLACWVPARRATRADPVIVLQGE
jgi:putative ABC transport system permease protein